MLDKNDSVPMVIFRLINEEFSVEVRAAREIVRVTEIAPIPQSPDFIKGIINLRGHVVAVIDLRKRFGLPAAERTEKTRIMIVHARRMIVGLIVDAVMGVRTFSNEMIQSTPAIVTTQVHHRYISGMVRWNKQIVLLLNLEEVLTHTETEFLKTVRSQA